VRVPHSEGVANHTDPLSCVGRREVPGEALAGESMGQPSSRESRFQIGMLTPYWVRKATWMDAISRGPIQSRVVRDPGTCRRSLDGNREVSRVTACPVQRSASGRRGAVADDART
jgi:hypothetical protein